MSTSKHTFDQVKSILGKLDRSIDDARAKRLDGDSPAADTALAPSPAPLASPVVPAAPPAHEARSAEFGPARPLRATPNYSGGGGGPATATPFKGRSDRAGF